jgi:hypothetical protein
MQREPAFEAAALQGWSAVTPDADAAVDERVTAWVGGGLSLLLWAVATAMAIHWL